MPIDCYKPTYILFDMIIENLKTFLLMLIRWPSALINASIAWNERPGYESQSWQTADGSKPLII